MRFQNLVASGFVVLGFVACTTAPTTLPSSSSPSADSSSDTKQDSDGTTPASSSSSTPTATPPSSASDDTSATTAGGVCAAKSDDADACWQCCENQNADTQAAQAKEAVIDKQYQSCACAASRCASACQTDYCAPGANPSGDVNTDACQTCLDEKTDTCDDQTDAAYTANEATPGYQAITSCAQASACGDDDDDTDADDDDDDN